MTLTEHLETLNPAELADAFAQSCDAVSVSKGFAVYGGDSREAIVGRYLMTREFLISQLTKRGE